MKTSKALCLFFTIFFTALCAFGCEKNGGYTHPDFKTEYTETEHLQRIEAETETLLAEQIEDGSLVGYEVEIVYAFYDNDPEYFLVTLEFAEEWSSSFGDGESKEYYTTKYKHIIGYIENDRYKTGTQFYDGEFIDGRSAYEICGYKEAKKYYGFGNQAVEMPNGELLWIFDGEANGRVEFGSDEKQWKNIVMDPMDENAETWMTANPKLFPKTYSKTDVGKNSDFQYSTKEILAMLAERTENRFSQELASGEIIGYKTELLYQFHTKQKRLFLVTLEYAEEQEGSCESSTGMPDHETVSYKTKFRHTLGCISEWEDENGELHFALIYSGAFTDGRSAYDLCGHSESVKYYGRGIFGVENDEGLFQIFDSQGNMKRVEFGSDEEQWASFVISEESQRSLAGVGMVLNEYY